MAGNHLVAPNNIFFGGAYPNPAEQEGSVKIGSLDHLYFMYDVSGRKNLIIVERELLSFHYLMSFADAIPEYKTHRDFSS